MKKVISISLVLLMIATLLHLSVADHFCNGKQAASKISLTGKLADCGMDGKGTQIPFSGTSLSVNCCYNVVISYAIDYSYKPSFSFVPESYQDNFQILSLSPGFTVYPVTDLKLQDTNNSPPGVFMSTNVDLSDICVFRI